ncbi:MAG: GIY-YIG nuclease family protein [Patescibacteria group bacterium]|jgi:putative endonuclease
MEERNYYVYFMTNPNNSVIYTGVTNDISRRVQEHKEKYVEGFTKRYNCTKLVYVEVFSTAYDAISREKQIKGGSRNKKMLLIAQENPTWRDISEEL